MNTELEVARLALRRALVRRQLARLELMHAMRAVQDALPNKNTTPALLRRQAG
jgi:hypothetical protein